MNSKLRDTLLQFDEVGAWEGPSSFDYDELRGGVERLHRVLNRRFGSEFRLDDQIQDASFQVDLKLPKELYDEPSPSSMNRRYGIVADINCAVRISNFGRLSTICFEEQCKEGVANGIRECLSAEGFIYVPAHELDVPYDGLFEDFKGDGSYSTWWIRDFDYI